MTCFMVLLDSFHNLENEDMDQVIIVYLFRDLSINIEQPFSKYFTWPLPRVTQMK